MIIEANGDLLHADVDALVNTVNCVGVMGKGIALQFKRRYPNVFKAYEKACRRGEVEIGRMFVVPTGELSGPGYVINFPTKKHWRSPSSLKYIELGLEDLRRVIRELGLRSIAIPPLGSGNGGLNWHEVEPLIVSALADIEDLDVQLFAPTTGHRAVVARQSVRMTWGRAVMLNLLRSYVEQRQALEPWEDLHGASHLEIQKLMYFADVIEPRLALAFAPGRYGPYSERVRHLIQGMEGSLLAGFGDGSGKALALEPIAPTQQALGQLDAYLAAGNEDVESLTDSVLHLIAGFEGPYGVELLASTHWVAVHEDAASERDAASAVRNWTRRKGRIYTDDHVATALEHLQLAEALPGATSGPS